MLCPNAFEVVRVHAPILTEIRSAGGVHAAGWPAGLGSTDWRSTCGYSMNWARCDPAAALPSWHGQCGPGYFGRFGSGPVLACSRRRIRQASQTK
jgi:hypothetical protein